MRLPARREPRGVMAGLGARLRAGGAASLSDLELLTVLLGCGGARSPERPARRLVAGDGLPDLAVLGVRELASGYRLGRLQAAALAVCFELGRRLHGAETGPPRIQDAAQVHAVTRDLELARREHFVVLHLDARNQVLSRKTVSVGSLNTAVVHPREVFRSAVEHGAASVILVHNHPSGDPEPSTDDLALTRRLVEAGSLLGIEVLDHVVIGRGRFVSLKTRGVV